jgi:hypothetical protein
MGVIDSERHGWYSRIAYPDEINTKSIVGDSGFLAKLKEEFGMRYLRGSVIIYPFSVENEEIRDIEPKFRSFLQGKNIKHAVEIGTWRGVSSCLLSRYAEKVTTIDKCYHPERVPVWMYFGILSDINSVIVEDDYVKAQAIDTMDFDFAFVDGDHTYEGVEYDFNLVKKCGRVLFHDYGIQPPRDGVGVTEFVDTLEKTELTLDPPFAYWEAK